MKHHVAVMVLCSLAVVGSALADDLYPPQWRGLDGSTLAAWEFSTSDVNPAVDLENNPYGPSSMTIGLRPLAVRPLAMKDAMRASGHM